MPISVAEYLGQRVDVDELVVPHTPGTPAPPCPFMNKPCLKITSRNKPICSVRQTDGTLWVVCRHRLCATQKSVSLNPYQRDRLMEVARMIFGADLQPHDIAVKREVPMPVTENSDYAADYVMIRLDENRHRASSPHRVVLEMQGGGETSNTGKLTRHVDAWEKSENPTNAVLRTPISGVGAIVTNAWRRQQEQFLVKGNISVQTGGAMVFCVGGPIFDYLTIRIAGHRLPDLHGYNWSLALVGYVEDETEVVTSGRLPLKIDPERVLFTSYQHFLQILINQGEPHPSLFTGAFEDLTGQPLQID